MDIEHTRDLVMQIAIFGLFGSAWMGWAQERPPASWRLPLKISAAASLLLGLFGVYLAVRHWNDGSALASNDFATFGMIVALEVFLITAGAAYLSRKKLGHYVSSWVAFVVAIHFLPFVWPFDDPWYYMVTLTTLFAAALAFRIVRVYHKVVTPSAVTGTLMGATIFMLAVRALAVYLIS